MRSVPEPDLPPLPPSLYMRLKNGELDIRTTSAEAQECARQLGVPVDGIMYQGIKGVHDLGDTNDINDIIVYRHHLRPRPSLQWDMWSTYVESERWENGKRTIKLKLCHCGAPAWGSNGACGVSGCSNVPC